MIIPYIVTYAALALFLIAVILRIIMWIKLPLHLRWELYPVPHEASRAHYGGSYLEETDWWKKPREKSLWGELKVMLPEIFFLVALREHNRKLWNRSFPFHFGLYLVIACTLLMMSVAVIEIINVDLLKGSFERLLHVIISIVGIAGLILGLFGALGLLQHRFSDPDLKSFTVPADIFNLIIFVIAFGIALANAVVADIDFSNAYAFIHNMIAFNPNPLTGTADEVMLTTITVIALGLLTAYIPMTHMSHFIGKYFAYHAIRWNDTPNVADAAQDKVIQQNLAQPISWNAPHIKGDGRKTWADAATEAQGK